MVTKNSWPHKETMQQILLSTWNDVMKNCFLYQQLLVALVSTYRYEGSWINDVAVRSEAIKLGISINRYGEKKKLFKDEETIRILATRSKPHLKAIFKCYKETFNKNIEEV